MSKVVSGMEQGMSLQLRGQLGFNSGCGMARCGYSRCGASKIFGGIYQRTKTLEGWRIVRKRYHRPTNPQTVPQQAWRAVFAAGVSGYQALTSDQKKALNIEARKYRQSGLTLFLRRYLQSNR